MVDTTKRPPKGRGCGDRAEGAAYVCCGTSPFGSPIEHFVIDPARPWPHNWQRGVKILPRGNTCINDLVIFVGREWYPSTWDFFEEVRRFGASRRVPKDLPFEQLTPIVSRMVFIHAKAIPDFTHQLDRPVPVNGCKVWRWHDEELWEDAIPGWHPLFETNDIADGATTQQEGTPCTFGLRDLAFLQHWDDAERNGSKFTIKMPSFSYRGKYPEYMDPIYSASDFDPELDTIWKIGIFLALPLTHVEFAKKSDPEAEEKVQDAGFECEVLDW